MRLAIVATAAMLMVAGCGSTTGTAEIPSPSPITTPAAGFDVLVTERDRAVTVETGQKVEVALARRPGMTDWGPIRIEGDSGVLAPMPTGITAPRGESVAGFVAIAPGTTTITSTAGPQCSAGQACPQYAMLFSVEVTVT